MNQLLSDNKEHNFEQVLIQLFVENCCEYLRLDCEKIVIKESESPDFVLCDGNNCIGIEITKALDQNLQKADCIKKRQFKDAAYCPTLFEDKNMKSEEIAELLRKSKANLIGKPYFGDGLEEKTVCNIIKIIKQKLKKFDKYTQYERNILLVHSKDRVTLNHDFVINKLKEYVSKNDIRFNYICLQLGDLFHFFSEGKYVPCAIKA